MKKIISIFINETIAFCHSYIVILFISVFKKKEELMMKRKAIAWLLILLLALSALSGCKQENSLESAAPGDVVEKPETNPTEQDAPVAGDPVEEKKEEQEEKAEVTADQEQGEKQEETAKSELFICKFLIRIKDEFVPKNYDESDFSEISISDYSVKTFLYPDGAEEPCASEIIITSEMNSWERINEVYNALMMRSDIKTPILLTYEAYWMIDDQVYSDFPDLNRAAVVEDGFMFNDGVISVKLKEGTSLSLSLFQELKPEGITGGRYDGEAPNENNTILLYVKERGKQNLQKIITKIKSYAFVESADYLREFGSIAE